MTDNVNQKQNYIKGCTRFQIATFLNFLFGDNMLFHKEKNRVYYYVYPDNFFNTDTRINFKNNIEEFFNKQIILTTSDLS